ncbi:MAG TPA: bifunctional transaldolase/phosoglucose isomerase [Xanthobacteraceae bacterium]|nr:bifunctional transaldolase/phosoglucose isomerase [Xanthobacteraceae bacterium]
MTTQNPLLGLRDRGQAVWLDFLSRDFLRQGGLDRLIAQDGLAGVTSNPAIFEKAIAQSPAYDEQIERVLAQGWPTVTAIYEELAIADIRDAGDALRRTYDATDGADGFVSLEVSPYLADDTAGTIEEARRLWQAVGRENLMIKVPGTPAGLPAIRQLIGEGLNINITLLFSQDVYAEVAEAYLAGLEHMASEGQPIDRVASVASFFVSRIDTVADKLLTERMAAAAPDARAALAALRGKTAIANAKLAYRLYHRLFAGPRWAKLKERGARPQRLLWASTSTKNPDYRDVLYAEELIGPETVDTLPEATMDAFRDHGRVRDSLREDVAGAERMLAALERAGVSLTQITADLVVDGVRLFSDAFDKLLGAVAAKRARMLGAALNSQAVALGQSLQAEVDKLTEAWRADGKLRRLERRDALLWTGRDEDEWLGWLDVVEAQLRDLERLDALADDVRAAGFRDAVLLGMGGSSLGPQVLAEGLGAAAGFPRLHVLDSTDPAQIRTVEAKIDPARTLFIVSSKSGTTLEPNVLMDYFRARVAAAIGAERAAERFIAITDPGSPLHKLATREGFRAVFDGVAAIGGRYSVLSPFGMVPLALMGRDVRGFLEHAQVMVRTCGFDVPPAENPAVQLGLVLGALAKRGRDKVTIVASPSIADFPPWAAQLLAESTGKTGKGLIPIVAEPPGTPAAYGADRLFIYMRHAAAADAAQDAAMAALEAAGQPVVRIGIADPGLLGQEFFRWEVATAVAGAVIGVNPFDQPDVEASKVATRELTAAAEKRGALPPETPVFRENGIALFADAGNAAALRQAGADDTLESWLRAHLGRLHPGDYFATLAYIERDAANVAALQGVRTAVRDRKQVATCVEFGPRFLHSTGQAYKGGPNTGVFLQITADGGRDLPVPGRKATFAMIQAAEARGDLRVLAERGRRVLRAHIGGELNDGLAEIDRAARRALG